MKYYQHRFTFVLLIFLLILPEVSFSHIKWFVEFDVSDPPKSLSYWIDQRYIISLFILSSWGIVIACLIDSFWCHHYGKFTAISKLFIHYNDIGLNIIRIGTGLFFVILWIVGDVILTPDLVTESSAISHLHLIIAISVLFRPTVAIAGIGILFLYGYATYNYGLFHLLDYLTFVGLGLFLILSNFKHYPLSHYRFQILYGFLIFSFLWSAVEKLAYPQWFYPFLAKYPFLTMGLDNDLFIACAAIVEFTLFFLLLMGNNGVILVAFLSNLLIISGNIYFGKIDAIGHFPVNVILLVMLVKGPLPIKTFFFDHSCKPYSAFAVVVISFISSLLIIFSLYYSLHWLIYE
ncbi:MAG: hypothetical protein KAG34_12075 [Cocleimonas sp.]|nr:hypothetical protein [Cocleimonas sp.]